jgi:glycosyl transferase, family 25
MALLSFFRNVGAYLATVRKKNTRSGTPVRQGRLANIPIFVINLERNRQRREFALQKLAGLGLKGDIFPAVDGKTLVLDKLIKDGIYDDAVAHEKFSRSLSMGEIGCSLSHLRLYKKILDEHIGLALVLEDDAMFVEGAREQLADLLERLPDDADLVQLIYECKDYSRVAPGVVRFLSKSCMPVASAGFLIRESGARKLLAEGYPVRYPADSFIGRSPRWGTNVYGASPKLVAINNIFPSEIYQGRTLKSRLGNRVKAVFVRLLG